jgi:hypothetical protein
VKRILRRRPSPAMVVAMIALFVALGGVSYGFATGSIDSREIKNNEVRSLDLRDNQIRSRDIRNNEVRGIDIRNSTIQSRDIAINAVRGEDVKEDTLAKVPSAMLADSATSATSADSVTSLKIIPQTTVAEGADPATLASHGPLTLLGKCAASGPDTVASLAVRTSENNSAADGEDADAPDIDAGTTSTPLATATSPGVQGSEIVASAPSGKAFAGVVSAHATSGSCKFHGFVTLQG